MPDSDACLGLAVQGMGAGAITSTVLILLSDLATLRERGMFNGLMALFNSTISPLVPFFCFVRSALVDGSYTGLGLSVVVVVQSLEDH
jgi:MFS family permease